MLTLKKLVKAITAFASNHEQVNSFYFNEIKHYAQSESVKYPAINCFLDGATTGPNTRILKMQFVVMDKVRGDQENQTEVLSDTELIILDLLSYFKQLQFDEFLTVDFEEDYENFMESYGDNCSGWSIELKFRTIFEWDLCSVPVSSLPEPDPYFGKVLIKDQDNNIIAVLDPGSEYYVTILSALQDSIDNNTISIISNL